MPKSSTHNELRDPVLMKLCRKEARKRGFDPDEPSFKAYCTRLYNQTVQGLGSLVQHKSHSDAQTASNWINRLFANIGFPYTARPNVWDGGFVEFNDEQGNNVPDENVAKAFDAKFGSVVKFWNVISPYWANDPSVKRFVERFMVEQTTQTLGDDDSEPKPPKTTKTKPSSRKKKTAEPAVTPAPSVAPEPTAAKTSREDKSDAPAQEDTPPAAEPSYDVLQPTDKPYQTLGRDIWNRLYNENFYDAFSGEAIFNYYLSWKTARHERVENLIDSLPFKTYWHRLPSDIQSDDPSVMVSNTWGQAAFDALSLMFGEPAISSMQTKLWYVAVRDNQFNIANDEFGAGTVFKISLTHAIGFALESGTTFIHVDVLTPDIDGLQWDRHNGFYFRTLSAVRFYRLLASITKNNPAGSLFMAYEPYGKSVNLLEYGQILKWYTYSLASNTFSYPVPRGYIKIGTSVVNNGSAYVYNWRSMYYHDDDNRLYEIQQITKDLASGQSMMCGWWPIGPAVSWSHEDVAQVMSSIFGSPAYTGNPTVQTSDTWYIAVNAINVDHSPALQEIDSRNPTFLYRVRKRHISATNLDVSIFVPDPVRYPSSEQEESNSGDIHVMLARVAFNTITNNDVRVLGNADDNEAREEYTIRDESQISEFKQAFGSMIWRQLSDDSEYAIRLVLNFMQRIPEREAEYIANGRDVSGIITNSELTRVYNILIDYGNDNT
jgi:hypothetical protein